MNADQVIKKLSLFRRLTGAAACNLRLLVSEPYAYVIQKWTYVFICNYTALYE